MYERTVALNVFLAQIGEHPLAASDHHHQATPGVKVVLMFAQVVGQLVDTRRQQRDLNLRRTGITLMGGVSYDDILFNFSLKRHCRESLLISAIRHSLAQFKAKVNLETT